MVKFICDSCKGNLKIPDGIEIFTCNHCSKEWVVNRSDEITNLKSVKEMLEKIETHIDNDNWYSIEELIQKGQNLYGLKPIKIKLPDGHIIQINKWVDVVEKVLFWLYDNKKLTTKHCPIPNDTVKERFYINTSPEHPTGKKFIQEKNIHNKIYIEINYNSRQKLKNLRKIFNTIKEDYNDFKISISSEPRRVRTGNLAKANKGVALTTSERPQNRPDLPN